MAPPLRIEGTYTALVTPFADDAAKGIDWRAFDALLEAQLDGGIDGVVPCGTTGESPSLSEGEHIDVIRRTVSRAGGRVRVLAGTGTNSTRESVERSRLAERAGVDAVMVVVPYYNRPTQDGLVGHFVEVAKSVGCPVVIYNIPSRTGVDLLPDSLARICDDAPNVVAVKEATGNVLRAQTLVKRFGERLCIMSGDDTLTVPMMAIGARGVISVTSNLLPKDVARLTKLAADGRFVEARHLHLELLPVHEAMFLEANPAPVKAALAMRGLASEVVRGPLAPVSAATKLAIRSAVETYVRGRE